MSAEPAIHIPEGFLGKRGDVLADVNDGDHYLRIVRYTFDEGSDLYVEAFETHDDPRPGALHHLAAVVHALQNMSGIEVFQIGNRDEPATAPEENAHAQE